MKVVSDSTNIRVCGNWYDLEFDLEQLLGRLEIPGTELYYYMSLLSAVDVVGQADETLAVDPPTVTDGQDCCLVKIPQHSNFWNKKTLVYECRENSLSCYVMVEGKGQIDRAHFFRGRYGPNELGSIPGFDTVYSGCPNFLGKNYFHASEYLSINSGHEDYAWGPALSTGPLCYALSRDLQEPWLSVGIAATEGEYGFQSFEFNRKTDAVAATWDSIVGTQSFSIAYYGHEQVTGSWQSPRLVFNLAPDKYQAIEKYLRYLYANKFLTMTNKKTPSWWRKPIFCGWHEQVATGTAGSKEPNLSRQVLEGGPAGQAQATQQNYTKWLKVLRDKNIKPGTIIIDALWQQKHDCNEVDEKKWPDLRGFIDDCHGHGQKVLLWMECWPKRHITDPSQCITKGGEPVSPDPTNPKHAARLKKEIRLMLGSDPNCYNADGLKIDATTVQPYGYDLRTHGDLYGFELQKYAIKLIYDAAHTMKEDALVSLFVANPYFRDVADMVRLGDLYSTMGDPVETVRTRAKIVSLAMPQVPIDTDGSMRFSMRNDYRKMMAEHVHLGVPTIYNAKRLMRTRTFALPVIKDLTGDDYSAIVKAIDDYENNC